ncbi:MAG: tetratricopeptide repeat protein [Chloroflexi bacterium]|nr:tetratricopeptide repeat protein [Chloroflexota bacterium]
MPDLPTSKVTYHSSELKIVDASPNNLPVQLTSFVGRDTEMAEVKRLLSGTHLLTLTGVGGTGKTRLSLQVAADLLEAFPNGVWLVELAPVADPTLVPQSIAAVLGVSEQPGMPLVKTLTDYLRAKHLLLILDNCEHLVAACAQVAESLLRACPQVRILATSREALGIAGESTFHVPSLPLPDPLRLPSLETLTQYEAVRLFIDRALAVRSDFTVTNANALAVAQVCYRLDGIPLALELAAARVRAMPVEEIARRLDDRFSLLTGGSRTALPRQQTLRASIDWSYDLLGEHEGGLLWRLAVFAGGWTLEAAEVVCAGEDIADNEVLELLTHLVDKSLVVAEEQQGEARYRLLETIRQYAQEKLHASAEEQLVRTRHLEFFLKLAEEGELKLKGPYQVAWRKRLENDYDNLHGAMQWAIESNAEAGLRLGGALYLFWYRLGYLSEGRRWLEKILANPGAVSRSAARAKALQAQGVIAGASGADQARALAPLKESISIWRELGVAGKPGLAAALSYLSFNKAYIGNYEQAQALVTESITLWREVGDKGGLAQALRFLSNIKIDQGSYGEARKLLEECQALFRDTGDSLGMAQAMRGLGLLAENQGDDATARAWYEQSLPLRRELGDKIAVANALSSLGQIAVRAILTESGTPSDYERANALLEEGLAVAQEMGNMPISPYILLSLGQVALAQGENQRAAKFLLKSLALFRELWPSTKLVVYLAGVAEVARFRASHAPEGSRQLDHAVRLCAVADALLKGINTPLVAKERADYDRTVAALRTQVEESVFATAWAEGQAMTPEQAVASALQEAVPEPAATSTPAPRPMPQAQPEAELRISALGPPRVYRGEQALTDWTYAKSRDLLFFLLCHPPRTKEQVGLEFWPDAGPEQLRSSFRTVLHHLRRTLGRSEWIIFEQDRYAFNHALDYWFDVKAFETNLKQARHLKTETGSAGEVPASAILYLEAAVQLYQGDFLEGILGGEWVDLRREALRQQYLEALLTLGQHHFAASHYEQAAEIYRRAIARDSYLEAAHRELMRCQARQGERGQALRHYQALVELMRAELGAPPAPETQALYERLQRGADV